MFASEDTIIRLVHAEISKEFSKAWEDLGLTVATFTSDDKSAVLLLGYGEPSAVAKVTILLPPEPKAKPKGGKPNA